MAEYLDAYARAFDLPIHLNSCVTSVQAHASGDGFLVWTREDEYWAGHVVVATGGFQAPYVPSFSYGLDPDIVQVHSSGCRQLGGADRR